MTFPNNFPAHSRFSTLGNLRLHEFCQELDPALIRCPLAASSPQQTFFPCLCFPLISMTHLLLSHQY